MTDAVIPRMDFIRARVIEVGDCWEWRGARDTSNNPVMRRLGERNGIGVRRHILLSLGVSMEKRRAVPACGNQDCVNPAHMAAWTSSRVVKRAAAATGYGHNPARNEAISAAKRKRSPFTPEQVREIRESPESGRAIARRLNRSQATIQRIRSHATWKDYRNPFFQLKT